MGLGMRPERPVSLGSDLRRRLKGHAAASRAALLGCCVLLSACTALGTRPPEPRPEAPAATPSATSSAGASTVATVQAAPRHQFSGRLSLRVQQVRTGATDGATLLFEFEGTPQDGTLVLQTVIGTAVATARWDAQGAEIITPQGKRTGPTLDDVAVALLGQALPLEALLHWVRAQPWGKASHQASPEGFEQLGWAVSLEGWHERVITARRSARADRPDDLDITVRTRLDEAPSLERAHTP
jgi:outer membrane lipoprotein LolB